MCFESKEAAFAAVCQERDELRQIVDKQAVMNLKAAEQALELDGVKAERDAYLCALKQSGYACDICVYENYKSDCTGECQQCVEKCECYFCDKQSSRFVWIGEGGGHE